MKGIFLRTLITLLGLFLASSLIPGVPIAYVLTFPITLVTLGFFVLVLNAAMFGLVAALLDNFVVTGFWPALFGALIVSFTSTIASWYIGPDGRVEVIVVRQR